jgi:hypothetical protein
VSTAPTPAERRQYSSYLAHLSWGKTEDRAARTSPAREKFEQRFIDQADGDPVRAASLRKAYYANLALQSAKARRERSQARKGAA